MPALVSMKYFVFVLGLLGAATAYAQRGGPPLATAPVVYCLLVVNGSSFSSPTLSLDYGQNMRQPVQDAALANVATQIYGFTSVPAGLNYRYSQGWECVQTATLPHEVNGRFDGQIGCLLRRRPP